MIILEDYSNKTYDEIFDYLQMLDSNDIENIHSVDADMVKNDLPNIVFDFDYNYRVSLTFMEDGNIEVEAPDDVKDFVMTILTDKFPQYAERFV